MRRFICNTFSVLVVSIEMLLKHKSASNSCSEDIWVLLLWRWRGRVRKRNTCTAFQGKKKCNFFVPLSSISCPSNCLLLWPQYILRDLFSSRKYSGVRRAYCVIRSHLVRDLLTTSRTNTLGSRTHWQLVSYHVWEMLLGLVDNPGNVWGSCFLRTFWNTLL